MLASEFDQIVPALCQRLKRIAGQAQGIERMLVERRDCSEIVTQVSALKAAVEQVGVSLVACLMEQAIRQAVDSGVETGAAISEAKAAVGQALVAD